MGTKKNHISWEDVENLVDTLHQNILKSDIKLEHIHGLPRGGLIPAVILSHRMGIPLTSYMYLPNTLIIDDICDSGYTLKECYIIPKSQHTAVLHYKPHTSIIEPDLYACKFESDDWIVYPWEEVDSKAIQDYKIKAWL